MNQIYACRKGRDIPFTDTTSISTVPTAKRSGSRTVFTNLFAGMMTLFLLSLTFSAVAQNDKSSSSSNRVQRTQVVNAPTTVPNGGAALRPIPANSGPSPKAAVSNSSASTNRDNPGTDATATFNCSGTIGTYTVPAGITMFTVYAAGAGGANGNAPGSIFQGGTGTRMVGTFATAPGTQYKVLAGCTGSGQGGVGTGNGGGGGSFVTSLANSPLIVAGGGGGGGDNNSLNKNANVGTSGNNAFDGGVGGVAGNGGNGGGVSYGSGGGLLTNGVNALNPAYNGFAFVNGGAGGNTAGFSTGGFGGGGSGSGVLFGGGGGGYSGGGGDGNTPGVGGGGGSFNNGTNQLNTANFTPAATNGSVVIIAPTLSYTMTSTNGSMLSVNGNNTTLNDRTITICDGGTINMSNLVMDPVLLGSYCYTSSNIQTFTGGCFVNPPPSFFVGPFNNFFLTPGQNSGFLDFVYTPYYDADGSGTFNAGDALGQDVRFRINVVRPEVSPAVPTTKTICTGSNTNIALTSLGGPNTFSWTIGTVTGGVTGQAPGTGNTISQVLTNLGGTDGTVEYIVTATNTASGCTSPPYSIVVTVRPSPEGIILNSGGQTVCVGNTGSVNIFLVGTPNFAGTFTATVLNGAPGGANTVINWTTTNTGGPQAITIPASSLTNTSNSAITYRIEWGTLADNTQNPPSCPALGSELQGFDDIVVMPRPQLIVTLTSPAGPICPGSTVTFNVQHTLGNSVPGNFQWFANGVLQGSNIDFDAPGGANVSFVTANTCNVANTFLFQPRGDASPNCQGTDQTINVTSQDVSNPTLIAFPPSLLNGVGTVLTPGPQGNVCQPPQATYQPTTASVRARYTDNCTSNANLTVTMLSAVPTGNNCAWTWTYTFRIQDACGNFTDVSYPFSGGDTGAPVISTPAGSLNRTVQYCDNVALAAAQALTVTGTDNCTGMTVTKTPGIFAVGSCPTQGTITNTFTISDGCGNTSTTFTQVITIVDTQGPSITGANTQTLNIGGPNCQALLPNYVTGTGGILPNSPLVPLVITDCAAPGGLFPAPTPIVYNQGGGNSTSTQSPAPGTLIIGAGGQIVPVTITATDACGNQSQFVINVTLLDQTPPVARCHNVTLALGAGGTATLTPTQINGNQNNVAGNGTAPSGTPAGSGLGVGAFPSTDNCSPVPTPSLTLTFPFGSTSANYSCANIGANAQTLVVTDAAGNFTNCAVTVTVVDAIAPTFTCPGTQTISRNANCVAVLPDFRSTLGIVASDNCTPSGSMVWTQTPIAGTIYGSGVTTTNVTLTATDGSGNVSAVCNITVNFVDNIAPVITCQGNMTVFTGPGNTDCAVVVNYTVPTATDNCQGPGFPGAISTVRIAGPPSGGQFFVGPTVVTYRATDAAGNSSTCSFTVTVVDNTLPSAVCVSDKVVNAGAGCVYTHPNTSWAPAVFDNCLMANPPISYTGTGATNFGGVLFSVQTLVGRTFNLGVTTVTVRVADASGNISNPCTFTVTVLDGGLPAFTNCPPSFTVNTAAPNGLSGCRSNVTLPQPSFTSNCTTTLSWAIFHASGNSSGLGNVPSPFPMFLGVTQVQFRVDDANGNSAVCTYFVTVNNTSGGAITGTATAQQNAVTTSTVTFTGSNGTPNYCFTYDISVNGGPFGAPQTVCTSGGQSTVTVAQSNAVTGTYTYRLLSATDANGCVVTVASPNTATVTVIVGAPDLTSSQFFTSTQISPGQTINEIIVLRNVGTAATSGPISFTVTTYSPLSGLTVTQTPAGTNVTIGIDTYTVSAGWSFDPTTGTFTSNNVIPAGGSNTIGIRITRGTGGSAGANGAVTQTTTIAPGTGGGETPTNNNTISNTILKN